MKSTVVKHLKPEFEPVAVVWTDDIPDDALQFKEGRFGCILYLFAEASRRGRVAGGSRDTVVCPGGRAAFGFGVDIVESKPRLDHLAALFSKGLESARDQAAYHEKIEAARPSWRPVLEFGERRHHSFDMARKWILDCLPRYDVPNRYVLFKPLSETDPDENARAVIFPVSPLELAGLTTLLGSVVEGTDPLHVPQGADCLRIACFAYDQYEAEPPRAVLGMLDVDGRQVMRKRFRDDTLTLTIPMPLFLRIEQEAENSVLQIPAWSKLRSEN
ncbi:MAG: DUF169 domain-containing protein [Acidobacteriota bacterium]|jgi:hypothetical protein|nr:DUF169 domain-containing protein [Acidobacteriota bacterium]